MATGEQREHREQASGRTPRRVRLPGFVTDQEIGLGDAVKRVTATLGIRPCGGCERRAAALNRRLVVSGGPSRRQRY
ncbi:hypothetical protein CFP65_0925 [Kitasatospora sp. MMS16-BH015]|uniref:hypothetical protein n=1 Tax=Kitasatospora sp. MMS16-BH015 TaxID=2018025 RepID=UPI000CA164A5|nr:hypothetical protein [Kitasatospora sp. MMS16-BH015]AUG75846.1 hypothetical protein CFP65_0925 [Kitasatospora sp. MMS16-BH015]